MIVSKTLSMGGPLDHGVTTPTIDNIAQDGSALEENVSALVLVDVSALVLVDVSALGDISLLRVGSALGVVSALGDE